MYLEKSKARIKSNHQISAQLKGCTKEDVAFLEKTLKLELPDVYHEFLFWMGHSAGSLFRGTDMFVEHIFKIQEWAKELLVENNFPESLPKDAFVFMMHQGYQFLFFKVSEGENPPIYFYHEGITFSKFNLQYENFDEFLFALLNLEMP